MPGAVVPALFGVLNSVIFTRVFGAGEYGRFSLAIGVVALGAAALGQWLQQGIARYLPGEQDAAAIAALKAAAGLSLVLTMICGGALLSAACLVLRPAIGSAWSGMIWPASALLLTTVTMAPLATILQAEMRAKRHTVYNVVSIAARFGLSIALVWLYRRDPASLVISGAVTQALLLVPMWRDAAVRLPVGNRELRRNAMTALAKMFSYGSPMVGYFIAASVLAVSDRYVIQFFRGDAEVGIYTANYTIVSFGIGLITTPVVMAAHPFFMRAWTSGNRADAARWLGTITEIYLLGGVLLVGGMSVFSGDVARIALGPAFREGHRIMPTVLAGVVAWQVAMYTHKPLEFAGRTKVIFGLSIASALVNVAANVWLVPTFGYVAAAYTTLGAYVLYAVCTAVIGRKLLAWHVQWRPLGGAAALGCIGFWATLATREWVSARAGYGAGLAAAIAGACATVFVAGYRRLWTLVRRSSAGC